LRRRIGAPGSVLLDNLALIDGAGEVVGLLLADPTGDRLHDDLGSDELLGQILAVYEEKSDGKLYGGLRGTLWSRWYGSLGVRAWGRCVMTSNGLNGSSSGLVRSLSGGGHRAGALAIAMPSSRISIASECAGWQVSQTRKPSR
jgi:hypothetical protein